MCDECVVFQVQAKDPFNSVTSFDKSNQMHSGLSNLAHFLCSVYCISSPSRCALISALIENTPTQSDAQM